MKSIVLASLVLLVGLAPLPAAEATPRPNILWITCEDMSPDLGCYGDTFSRSPNIDRLARQGLRYTRAFSNAGVCAPSRSTLITGLYATSLGTHPMRCQGKLPAFITCFPEPLRQAGYYCSNNVKTDYNFRHRPASWDESSNRAHWRNRKKGQPFFSVFNLTTTHEGQIRAPRQQFERHMARVKAEDRHDPAKVPLPPYYPDTPRVRRDRANYYDLITSMDAQVGEILKQLEDDGLAEDTIVFFFSDHGVGLPRGKRWLYDSGTRVPLIIRFPKKFAHLAPGKPGSSIDRLVSFVDLAPTIHSLCGVASPKHLQGIAFLGERAGKPREYVFGIRDRMDERYDMTRSVRDRRYRYIRNYRPDLPWAQPINYMDLMPTMQEWRRLASAGKLTGPQKIFLSPTKPAEELYDLEHDPHEVVNLAGSREHRATLERLRKVHRAWQEETLDLGFLPEDELHTRAGQSTIYEAVRQDAKVYPLEKIRAAADLLTAEGDPTAKLKEARKDADSAVRWWAVIGLGVRGGEAALGELRASLKDSAPAVRVAAARALALRGQESEALPVLRAELQHTNEWVRAQAAHALDELGTRARPALEELRKALKDSNDYVRRLATHALATLGEQSP